MIQADESSYLMNASAIAGYSNDFSSSYHAGYSLLISPAFLLGDSPDQVWKIVVFINALMYCVGVLLLFSLARSLGKGKSHLLVFCSVLAAACYPMWVVMVGYSFSQVSFFLMYSLVALLVYRSLKGGGLWWVFSGVSAGYLYWIHPTGIAVCIALVLVASYEAVRQKRAVPAVCALMALVAMIVAYEYAFYPWLLERTTISGSQAEGHYPSLYETLKSLLDISVIWEIIVRFSGHVLYLTMGTLGLIWAVVISRLGGRDEERVAAPDSLLGFLYLSLFGVMALSVLFLTFAEGANRLDHFIYGRYVEGVLAPLLLLGALTLAVRTQVLSIAVVLVSAVILSVGMGDYSHTARMNVSAFWQDYYLREEGALVWGGAGILLIALTILLRKMSHVVTVVVVAGFFTWLSLQHVGWHVRAASAETKRLVLAEKVRRAYPSGTCVGFDHSGIDSTPKHVFWFDFGFMLYDYPLSRMSVGEWLDECNGPLFSYDENLDQSHGLHLVGEANNKGPLLWAKEPLTFEGAYPFNVEERPFDIAEIMKDGWHDIEARHVWSSGRAELKLPVPRNCGVEQCDAEIVFSVFNSSSKNPVDVFVAVDGVETRDPVRVRSETSGNHRVRLDLPRDKKFITVVFRVPEAVSPEELGLSVDSRVLGVALKSISLIKNE